MVTSSDPHPGAGDTGERVVGCLVTRDEEGKVMQILWSGGNGNISEHVFGFTAWVIAALITDSRRGRASVITST